MTTVIVDRLVAGDVCADFARSTDRGLNSGRIRYLFSADDTKRSMPTRLTQLVVTHRSSTSFLLDGVRWSSVQEL
jgi:hypothetical protein